MKPSVCRCLLVALCLMAAAAKAQTKSPESPNRYERSTEKYKNFWHKLIPNQTKLQYAGSIGLISASAGWHYGHNHHTWESDLFIGYLPRYNTRRSRLTGALKQSYIPFRININEHFDIEPLTCGIFLSTIFGEEFWGNQPSKYPKHYYGFSTKVRANLFVGQRLRFPIPDEKRRRSNSITLYYELSTSELYLISYCTNRFLTMSDILSLAFGLKFDLF